MKSEKIKKIMCYHQFDLRVGSYTKNLLRYIEWKKEKGYDESKTLFDLKVSELDELIEIYNKS